MPFKSVEIKDFNEKVFKLIGDEWMLITSGDKNKYNTMTASWGGVGVLWNKCVAFSFVRPQRYTFEFMENNDYYTLSFYDEKYKDALKLCGRVSGRDVNKVKEIGFSEVFDDKSVYFNEAKLVIVCKKIYGQFLDPSCFIDKTISGLYKNEDYHKLYIGEIEKVLVKDGE